MSAPEIPTLAQQSADAFTNTNLKAVVDMLSEDLEVFDHVPYRFDGKAQFATYSALFVQADISTLDGVESVVGAVLGKIASLEIRS